MRKGLLVFILMVFALPSPIPAADMDDLDDKTKKVMDEKGEEELREVMEKDELGEDMKSETENLRSDALKRTAKTLALQKAVKWRYGEIKKFLEKQSSKLDQTFDFRAVMMKGGKVVPPVITEAGPGYRVESEDQASSTDTVYEIVKEARMVSTPPSWRDYLLRDYPSFKRRDVQAGVLPENNEEREKWEKAALEGWKTGIRQAERLYEINLAELSRDFRGALKFKTLAEQNIVSIPRVSEGEMGIQVEGKKLNVNRQVFRITEQSKFKEVEEWKPKLGN